MKEIMSEFERPVSNFEEPPQSCVLKVQYNFIERDGNQHCKGVVLKNEHVTAIKEYAPNSIIVSTLGLQDLIVFENLEKIRRIISTNLYNNYWIDTLPGFDVNKFPFLACDGH